MYLSSSSFLQSKISWPVLLMAIAASLFITSCGSSAPEEETEETVDATELRSDTADTPLQIIAGGTTFIGVFPCDGCQGIQTRLTLNPNEDAYVKEMIYLGRSDSVHTVTGTFDIEEAPGGAATESLYILQPDNSAEKEYYLRLMESEELVQLNENRERPEKVEEYTMEKEGLQ